MSRGRPTASVLVRLDPASPEPLHRQIYAGLRGAILSGTLAPGVRVPSSRALAADLDVSRTTVLLAFEQLLTEGYLIAEPASGTRVAEQLPDDLLQVRGVRQGRRPVRPASAVLSRRGAALAAVPCGAPRLGPVPRAFRPCIPAFDLFPVDLWNRLASRRRRRITAAQLDYGDPAGFRPLREAIAAHVAAARGVRCTADQVLVMSGTHGALDLAIRLLLDPGEAAWLEEPGYLAARSALTAAGAAVVPVPVDGEGLDVETGMALGPQARLVYVCPSHQYPLGVSMSLSRRLALLRWAERSSAWILEDDYDSEYRYAGRPIPALQGLDTAGRVLYLGTFSKTLFPSLRLGFLIVPEALVEPFVAVRASTELLPPTFDQAVLADFLGEGHFARHVRRMRGIYEERLETFLQEAQRLDDDVLRLRPSGTGLHLVGELVEGMEDRVVTEEALARGVELGPLSVYYTGPARRQGLLLGFAAFDPPAIRAAMEHLARALDAARRRQVETPARRPA